MNPMIFRGKIQRLVPGLCLLVGGFPVMTVAQNQTAPKGYVAEVVDKSGTKMSVNSSSFGYTYSYTRSNCIGACGASSDGELFFLPINDGCGAWMIPLTEIASITGISKPSRLLTDARRKPR
jgi:hypothetical protein